MLQKYHKNNLKTVSRIFLLFLLFLSLLLSGSCSLNCSGEKKEDPVLLGLAGVLYYLSRTPVPCKSDTSRLPVSDPFYPDQWHLDNTGQFGGTIGEDINVLPVWPSNRGENIQIIVVDDGIDDSHKDLLPNINFSFNTYYGYPGFFTAFHGTSVAGIIGASDTNGRGVRGIAPNSCIASYNLLVNFTSLNESNAMTRNMELADISSNSWGFPDGTGHFDSPSRTWKNSVEYSLVHGRKGKGVVFVWAAGNGADYSPLPPQYEIDNSNYDGYANHYGVTAVCAVGNRGERAFYSEKGANLWVCAPSMGDNYAGISTTDKSGFLGWNMDGTNDYANLNYTKNFNGTSAAAPMVSGVAALMLAENPALTWRDVKIILARTARKNHVTDVTNWKTNAAGYNINYKYGFGVVDAGAAVIMAKNWINVGPFVITPYYTSSPGTFIPDNNGTGITDSINVSGSGITNIEYVEVTVKSDHTYPGDLQITLISPNGIPKTESILTETHLCAFKNCGSLTKGFRFGTARHLDEGADGQWSLKVVDGAASDTGNLTSWSLKFYGR